MATKRFDGKIAIVTGAAQGIGRATALRFAEEGAKVIVADRAQKQAEDVRQIIEEKGGTAREVLVDLETSEGARELIAKTKEAFGRIDISVHNVGGTIWMKPFWEYTEDEIVKEIQRSLWPTLWCCHAVIPTMIEQRAGAIVNVGSVATRGIYRVPYSAAKGGVQAMTTCMAMELVGYGIRVNSVAPGGVDVGERAIPRNPEPPTKQEIGWMEEVGEQTIRDTPMQRFAQPEEEAAAICFLASDDASYMTGQTLFVAGGGIG